MRRKFAPMWYTVPKITEKQQVIILRKQGKSYKEIQDRVGVSIQSISRWCREENLGRS